MSRRRSRPEDPENHDRWLVSYADFITLLFAFFVVMYAISTLNEGKYRVLSDSLLQAFRHDRVVTAQTTGLAPINRTNGGIEVVHPTRSAELVRRQKTQRMMALASRIAQAFGPLVQSGQVRLTQLPEGLAVEINASVLFAPASANVEPGAVAALSAVAATLAEVDNVIRVEGHTDAMPIGSSVYPSNWELSSARASAVVRLFIASGIASTRLAAIGYADNRPVEDNRTADGRARNRRVALIILDDATTAPIEKGS
jgi:chemotaxis protein MotB